MKVFSFSFRFSLKRFVLGFAELTVFIITQSFTDVKKLLLKMRKNLPRSFCRGKSTAASKKRRTRSEYAAVIFYKSHHAAAVDKRTRHDNLFAVSHTAPQHVHTHDGGFRILAQHDLD